MLGLPGGGAFSKKQWYRDVIGQGERGPLFRSVLGLLGSTTRASVSGLTGIGSASPSASLPLPPPPPDVVMCVVCAFVPGFAICSVTARVRLCGLTGSTRTITVSTSLCPSRRLSTPFHSSCVSRWIRLQHRCFTSRSTRCQSSNARSARLCHVHASIHRTASSALTHSAFLIQKVICTFNKIIVGLDFPHYGVESDSGILRDSFASGKYPMSLWELMLADGAYLSVPHCLCKFRKPRGRDLTRREKQVNAMIDFGRSRIEHINASIKLPWYTCRIHLWCAHACACVPDMSACMVR